MSSRLTDDEWEGFQDLMVRLIEEHPTPFFDLTVANLLDRRLHLKYDVTVI